MTEPLARYYMPNGDVIDLSKDDKNILMESTDGQHLALPRGTGKQTLDLCVLLESFCESVEYPEGEDIDSTGED